METVISFKKMKELGGVKVRNKMIVREGERKEDYSWGGGP